MIYSALFASLHYLALALGLGSVFMRGIYIRSLMRNPKNEGDLSRMLISDGVWGGAALLWIVSGLMRAFGGLEKGTEWYLHHPLFQLKMALFLLVWIIEMPLMISFIKWRISIKNGSAIDFSKLQRFRLHNDVEVVLIVALAFVASFMARGIGYSV